MKTDSAIIDSRPGGTRIWASCHWRGSGGGDWLMASICSFKLSSVRRQAVGFRSPPFAGSYQAIMVDGDVFFNTLTP